MSFYFTLTYYWIQISSSTESALNNQSVCVDKDENFEEIKEKPNPLQEKIGDKQKKQRCSSDNLREDAIPDLEGKEEDLSCEIPYSNFSQENQQLHDNEMSNELISAMNYDDFVEFLRKNEIRFKLPKQIFELIDAVQRMENRNDLQVEKLEEVQELCVEKSKVTQFNYAIQYLFEKIQMFFYIFYNFLFSPKQQEISNEKTEELRKN
ncbi:hypothetical protein GVAV_000410 [Gurleya vavrai]